MFHIVSLLLCNVKKKFAQMQYFFNSIKFNLIETRNAA